MTIKKYSQVLTDDPAASLDDGDTLPVCRDPGGTPATEGATVGQFRTLPYSENAIGSDIELPTTNTWVDGPSVSLDPGTWLVTLQLTLMRTATTALTYYARITDGAASTHYASGQHYHASTSNHSVMITLT